MTNQTIHVCENCFYKDYAAGQYPCCVCNEEDRWEDGVPVNTKTCDSCIYAVENGLISCSEPTISCRNYSKYKAIDNQGTNVAFIDKTEEGKATLGFKNKHEDAIKEPFDLDKLIDDHWQYVEDTLAIHSVYGTDLRRAEHHYKTAAKHFWKHCCEHYGIKEE